MSSYLIAKVYSTTAQSVNVIKTHLYATETLTCDILITPVAQNDKLSVSLFNTAAGTVRHCEGVA